MKHVYYYEYYPHYVGTRIATIKMSVKAFEELCAAGKDIETEEFWNLVDTLDEQNKTTSYAMSEAFMGRGRATRILNKVKKEGLWSGEWEEGSFAFATSLKEAKRAVKARELKHIGFD
jgi:hypothetical protein